MHEKPKYILVLDESGHPLVRDPGVARYGYIEGGFVVQADHRDELANRLRAFKACFLGDDADEVKGHHLASAMGSIGQIAEEEHALAHVSIALRDCEALFAGIFLDKADFLGPPDNFYTVATAKGGVRVNQQRLFEMLAIFFDKFLERRGARGEIVHDELHSEDVHEIWQAGFRKLRFSHLDGLSFVDSKTSDLVQMADTAIAMVRAHFEKKVILRDGALAMARAGEREELLIRAKP
jgi:hypothetical protein